MALDASIFARFTQPLRSVADYDREFYDAQNAKQAGQLNQLQLLAGQRREAEAQRAISEQEGVRNALAQLGAGAGDEQRINALSALGTPTGLGQADTLKKAVLERNKTQAEVGLKSAQADKERLAAGLQRFEIVGQIMGGVRDQASYDAARQQAVAQFGPEFASRMAPVYDPAAIAQAQQQAMSVKDRLEQEWKAKGYDREIARDTEIARHNQAGERLTASGQAITRRGQDMTDARSRETNAASVSKPFEVTGPDGVPVLVRQDKAGNITPVEGFSPKGMGATKLTEVQGNATAFATRMKDASKIVSSMEDKGVSGSDLRTKAAGSEWTNFMASSDGQQYRQAQENWVTANLRKESGAAIPKDEMEKDIAKWFPKIGDGPAVKKQKADARRVAEEAMLVQAGPGAKQVNAILEKAGSKPAASGWSVVEVK